MNFIISYPRSGNTFLRYCIEYLSHRPTLDCRDGLNGSPIYANPMSNITINNFNPIIRKEHHWEYISNYLNENSRIIFVLRDYKDCLLSHSIRKTLKYKFEELINKIFHYLDLLYRFDDYKHAKHLLYYEDFVENPSDSLRKIFDFLEVPVDLDLFIKNFSYHKKKSLSLYPHGQIKKNSMPQTDKEMLDYYVSTLAKTNVKKYLHRYL